MLDSDKTYRQTPSVLRAGLFLLTSLVLFVFVAGEAYADRFFQRNSTWYEKIPANPIFDPNSTHYVQDLIANNTDIITPSVGEWSVPVYRASGSTAGVTVNVWGPMKSVVEARGWHLNVPIPVGAEPGGGPNKTAACDGPYHDANMTVISADGRYVWDMQAVGHCDGVYHAYRLRKWDLTTDGMNYPNDGLGNVRSTASPLLQGLITYDEVVNKGVIDHAICMATWRETGCSHTANYPSGQSRNVAEWCNSQEESDRLPLMKMGERIQLDPSVSCENVCSNNFCRIACKALQDYGMVFCENSGKNYTTIYLENRANGANSYGDWAGIVTGSDLVNIPFNKFRVVRAPCDPAYYPNGCSDSLPTTDTIPPSTPTGLSAAVAASTQINLTWTASRDNVGIAGYRIYRNGSQIGTVTGTTYSNTGLSASTAYTYTVSAYDAAGNVSGQSAAATATTQTVHDTQAPSLPANVTATAVSSTQINLVWNPSTDNLGVAGYKVYKNGSLIATVSKTSYSDTGLSASTTYTYTISAYDAAGNASSQSGPVSATTQLIIVSSITTLKTTLPITLDGNLTESAWGQANFITFSNSAKSDNQVKVYTLWDDANLYFAYDVTDLNLEAINQAYYADDGAEIFLDTANNKSTSMDGDDYKFLININDLISATGIQSKTLRRSNGYTMEIAIPWSSINVIPAVNKSMGLLLGNNDRDNSASSQFDWLNLINSGSYARPNLWGNVIFSSQIMADTQAPSVPAGLTATAVSYSQINLSWSASSDNVGVSGYRVYRNGTQIATVATTSYSNTGLTASTTYSYTVTAFDAAGNVSGQSAAVSAATPAAPDTQAPSVPAGLTATAVSYSQINLSWSASSDNVGVSGYRVYRNGTQIATVATTSYSNTGLTASTTYSYTVTAFDAAGNVSGQSAAVSAATPAAPDTQAPSVPAGLTATAVSYSQINLSWSASSDNVGVSGYRVYRNGTQIAAVATTSYSNTGLSASTTYSYTVTAYDAAGNVSGQSAAVSATTPAAPDIQAPSVPTKYIVSGQVVRLNGTTPVVNASIRLKKGSAVIKMTTTKTNGTYAFLDVVPDSYTVEAVKYSLTFINQPADTLVGNVANVNFTANR